MLLLVAGCAHAPPPKPRPRHVEVTPEAPPRVKLTVIPVESDPFGKLARAVNDQLATVHLPGIDDVVVSKVTLEVVQLSIECLDPSNACYAAVGKSLGADRLLFAHFAGGTRRRDHSVKVTLMLFDVANEQPLKQVDAAAKNEDEAIAGINALVERLSASDSAKAKDDEEAPLKNKGAS